MMSEAKRLHPAAVIFDLLSTLRQFIFPIIIGFISFRGSSFITFTLILLGLIVIFSVINIITWYRFTYRIENDELRIEHGVFVWKKRHISKNRIQSIDLTSGVIHRLFNLTRVEIETAGTGTEAEASLSAVKLEEGKFLRSELKTQTHSEQDEAGENDSADNTEGAGEQDEYPRASISFRRLFLAATTSGSVGIIIAFGLTAFSQVEQFIPEHLYEDTVSWIVGLSFVFMIVMGILLLIVLWLLGIAGTIIKYGHFTITRNEKELFITRGLLEKKQTTIPLRRIQAVGIQESIIRQPLGYVTVFAEIAGGSMDSNEDFSSILFPIMKHHEVGDFLSEFLPEYADIKQNFKPLPASAKLFYWLRASWLFILLSIIIGWLFPHFVWMPLLLLLIAGIGLGWLRYRDAGCYIEKKRLTIRHRGFLNRDTILMYHKRLQAFEMKQHKLQKWKNLATMQLSIIGTMGAGRHFTIKDMSDEDTKELSDWYSNRNIERIRK